MKSHRASYLREDDLRAMGVRAVGQHVRVHESCVLVGLDSMSFGDNVRVDPFSVLTAAGGDLTVGSFVHISAHAFVSASFGVRVGDFVALSVGVKVFSRSDDYSGQHLTNPTVPAAFTGPDPSTPVTVGRHVIVGAGSVVLPEVTLADGVAVGANALVDQSLAGWGIYAGSPARFVRERRRDLLEHEQQLHSALAAGEAVPPVSRL